MPSAEDRDVAEAVRLNPVVRLGRLLSHFYHRSIVRITLDRKNFLCSTYLPCLHHTPNI